jgi:Arc/MetJ-type ribon-helix-helix transcriptional regulator
MNVDKTCCGTLDDEAYQVECRKKIYFFPTSATGQDIRVEEESQLNPRHLLLSKLLIYCRFGDNILFGLISHFCSLANLSTSENELARNKTKVISTRVTERFAELLEQYCFQDAYINCADLIRYALREKLRKDAPYLFKQLFDGKNLTADSDLRDVMEVSQAERQIHAEGVDSYN